MISLVLAISKKMVAAIAAMIVTLGSCGLIFPTGVKLLSSLCAICRVEDYVGLQKRKDARVGLEGKGSKSSGKP